jgi:chitinase
VDLLGARAVPALALAAALLGGCAQLPPAPPRHEVVGYYAGWKAAQVDARALTVLNYAFLDICWDGRHGHPDSGGLAPCADAEGRPHAAPNGSVVIGDAARDPANLARLHELKNANPRLRLVGSVGGWVWSNRFSDMAASAASRRNFADSVVAFMRRHWFDGIDLDWEYPGDIGVPCPARHTCQRPDDKRNFVALARELRAALDAAGREDGKPYLLTIAAGADDKFVFDASGSAAWLVELASHLDWINLMTYDYHGSWETVSGLNAPLGRDANDPTPSTARTPVNIETTVARWLGLGIPASKLTLGIPFYGKGWAGCPPGPRGDGLYQQCTGMAKGAEDSTFEFGYLVREGYLRADARGDFTLASRGFVRHWNMAAGVPTLYNPATQVFITYDDEASIRGKMGYLKAKRLRGAMYWALHGDHGRQLGSEIARALLQ